MTTPDMTASNHDLTEPSRAEPGNVHCPPMAHQTSGGHGYEMYPQQLVRLVGCHEASLDVLRKHQDEKLN
jgi:hypothetical protein